MIVRLTELGWTCLGKTFSGVLIEGRSGRCGGMCEKGRRHFVSETKDNRQQEGERGGSERLGRSLG